MDFVLCTNLTLIDKDHIEFIKEKNISISTSLDGPIDLHDSCRRFRDGKGSYNSFVEKFDIVKQDLGMDFINALITVTPHNLCQLKRVIDEYVSMGFNYVFLRKLNPFGKAYNNKGLFYSVDDFIKEYKKALDYIISLNWGGTFISEVYSTILLTRILSPFSTGFVDLQSPSGSGISGAIYDINGDVFVSDEARMIARTNGDKFFCIGNSTHSSWEDMFCSDKIQKIADESVIDSIPGCSWCAYKPYCGADPVRNYLNKGRMIDFMPQNDFCRKNMSMFDILFEYLMLDDEIINDVFWSWVSNIPIQKIRSVEFDCLEEEDSHDKN